jgi:NinB protein
VKRTFVLAHAEARRRAIAAVADAPESYVITVSEPTRSLDQNSALWPILQAFSDQLEWPVNGKMCKLSPDEWKDVLSAAFKVEHVRLAMGLDGGVVMLGLRTSAMGKRQFSEFLEFLHATAVARGVVVYEDA